VTRILTRTFCLVLLSSAAVRAQTPEQLFQQGNLMYQQGRLPEAREAYEGLLAAGYVAGDIYYNLGNTYYRTGDIGHAILNYERALRYIPGDEDLRHNLQLANLLITDRIEAAPRLFFWEYWEGLKNAFSVNGASWLFVLTFFLVFASLVVVVLARRYRSKRLALAVTALGIVACALALVLLVAKVSDFTRTDEGIVTTQVSTVKNSPDEKASDAFVLHTGVKVRVVDRVSEWLEIRLADGKVGWVEKKTVEMI
jgi:tetratricopeptide (TPR) repeat protein